MTKFIDEESDDDREDYNIRDSDALILAGKIVTKKLKLKNSKHLLMMWLGKAWI